jgi:GNAT superfamily N-acetyltransferase
MRSNTYRDIEIDSECGSVYGYVVGSDQVNIKNFLETCIGLVESEKIAELFREKTELVGVIKSIFVEEEARGNGVGNDLMGRFFGAMNSAEAIVLMADLQQEQSEGFSLVSFYEGFDFAMAIETSSGPLMVFPSELAEEIRTLVDKKSNPSR